jgi:tetratricopeptide (TPR) repeat protein/DNA-binding CsgD family transcriptional regulator
MCFTLGHYAQELELELAEIKKIDHLLDSASRNTMKNPQLAVELAESIKPQVLTNDRIDRLGFCYRILGSANIYLGDYPVSRKNYTQALNIAIQQKDTINIILGYSGIGLSYLQEKNYSKVDSVFHIVLPIAKESQNNDQILRILEVLGINNFYQHKFVAAINNYNDALGLAIQDGDSSHFSRIYLNLGNVYVKANQLDLAAETLIKGKNIAEQEKESYYKAHYYSSLGELYRLQKLNELSTQYYVMAIDTFVTCQNPSGVANASVSLAIALEESGEDQQAKYYLQKAYQYAHQINSVEILAYCFILKGKLALNNNEHDEALLALDSAQVYADQIDEISIEKDWYEVKYQVFEQQKKYKESFEIFKKYQKAKDSLASIENASKIEAIGLKKTLAILAKEKELQSQKLLLTKQREKDYKVQLLLSVIIFVLVTVLLIGLFFYRIIRLKKAKEIAQKNEALEKLNHELIALQLKETETAKKELETEVNEKNNRIKSLVHAINEKNTLLDDLSKEAIFSEKKGALKKLKRIIDSEEERAFFNEEINQMNVKFHQKLKAKYPQLSDKDLKLSSMLKMGLSSKEMATLLSISSSSVDVARSRLRKKMGISKEENITDFMNGI